MLTFIHIPKTAGSTINLVLRSSFGVRHCDVRKIYRENDYFMKDDLEINQKCWPFDIKSIASHDITLESKLNDPVFFTFLRDPIQRSVSHYQYYIKKTQSDISYEVWIQNPKMRNLQTSYFSPQKDSDEAIAKMENKKVLVGITENLDGSLQLLNSELENINIIIPKKSKNVSKTNNIKESILGDTKLHNLTIQANEQDIIVYNHFKNKFDIMIKYLKKESNKTEHSNSFLNLYSNIATRNLYYKPMMCRQQYRN